MLKWLGITTSSNAASSPNPSPLHPYTSAPEIRTDVERVVDAAIVGAGLDGLLGADELTRFRNEVRLSVWLYALPLAELTLLSMSHLQRLHDVCDVGFPLGIDRLHEENYCHVLRLIVQHIAERSCTRPSHPSSRPDAPSSLHLACPRLSSPLKQAPPLERSPTARPFNTILLLVPNSHIRPLQLPPSRHRPPFLPPFTLLPNPRPPPPISRVLLPLLPNQLISLSHRSLPSPLPSLPRAAERTARTLSALKEQACE
jgi:hypothetical protein